MVNPNVMYNVTGLYVDGRNLVGYHLVGEDGSQSQEGKERIIFLINQGIISNMRVQLDTDKNPIIRGKGINLKKLPVYDVRKQQFRKDTVSQTVANGRVPVDYNIANTHAMGQYTIVKRIMFKNNCLGYELQDYSGRTTRKKRDEVMNLANQKLISNAIVRKYKPNGSNEVTHILRGEGCELNKLPMLIVNEQGNIIDPTVDLAGLTVRGVYLNKAGIIYNKENNSKESFKAGDFILYFADGSIKILNKQVIDTDYDKDTKSKKAMSDDFTDNISNYAIEFFGSKPVVLKPDMLKSWHIFKHKK